MENPTPKSVSTEPAVVKFDGPRKILMAARKLIERADEWVGGGEQYDFTRCCAGVAIDRAARVLETDKNDSNWGAACYFYRAVIRTDNIIEWNDRPGRTHAEVLAAFDKAIAQCAVGDPDHAPAGSERA